MDNNQIKIILENACATLYEKHKQLIDERANERTIAALLSSYLENQFPGFEVVNEYNREGDVENREPKKNLVGELILPDIIVHQYGPDGENLVSVEVKGYWNNEPRSLDDKKLRDIQSKHGYQFLFRIELDLNNATVIEVK